MKQKVKATFILLLNLAAHAQAGNLPNWIISGTPYVQGHLFVVCSADALDPEDAQANAEFKCLSSAAKLAGVTVTVSSHTTESVGGVDTTETASMVPIKAHIACEWSQRYLEQRGQGYRVWLQCKVDKATFGAVNEIRAPASIQLRPRLSKKALILASSVPKADVILINGPKGERAVDVISNAQNIEVLDEENFIIFKRHGYKDKEVRLKDWENGESLTISVKLDDLN